MHRTQSWVVTVCAIALFWVLASPLLATTITEILEFPMPDIKTSGNVSIVSVKGLPMTETPGEPVLPLQPLKILLPQGEEVVSVTARSYKEEVISIDFPVVWAQPDIPLSLKSLPPPIPGKEMIYESTQPYPASRAVHATTQTYRGFNIAYLRVYPVSFIGAEGVLVCASRIEVTVETAPSISMLERSWRTLRPNVARDTKKVSRMVDNAAYINTYTSGGLTRDLSDFVDPSETYPYVIITTDSLAPVFEDLKELKDAQGLTTKIVTMDSIIFHYTGSDSQAEVREFIYDAYYDWETEYVLLGGDDEIIPHRGLFAWTINPPPPPSLADTNKIDTDIPSDLYYSALDGDWNDDDDERWGEPGEEDLSPEVCLGRLSVSDETEAGNFVDKIIKYTNTPVVDQTKTALMVGELLEFYNQEAHWGGDRKDEIKNGSTAYGDTTAGFPAGFTVGTLYDRDDPDSNWAEGELIDLLNEGEHIVNHLGHSTTSMNMKIEIEDVQTGDLTNNGDDVTYFFLYTQGCYAGAFDGKIAFSENYRADRDCIAEYFTFDANGAVAFIGNTRFGWWRPGDTNSASQRYDRMFFQGLFGEGLTTIGEANDYSRQENIALVEVGGTYPPGAARWVHYELVLLGDPSMKIWTEEPGSMTVEAPAGIYEGQDSMEVTVKDGSTPLDSARVTIYLGDTYYDCETTDAQGSATLDPSAASAGTLYVAVWRKDYYSVQDTVLVVPIDPDSCIVEASPDRLFLCPCGVTQGGGRAVDTLTVTVTLKDDTGDPVESLCCDLEIVLSHHSDNDSLYVCQGNTIFVQGETDSNGVISASLPEIGGCGVVDISVSVFDIALTDTAQVKINSPDILADGQVNLFDFIRFSSMYLGYHWCGNYDQDEDDYVDLPDFVAFSVHYYDSCPGGDAARRAMEVVYDIATGEGPASSLEDAEDVDFTLSSENLRASGYQSLDILISYDGTVMEPVEWVGIGGVYFMRHETLPGGQEPISAVRVVTTGAAAGEDGLLGTLRFRSDGQSAQPFIESVMALTSDGEMVDITEDFRTAAAGIDLTNRLEQALKVSLEGSPNPTSGLMSVRFGAPQSMGSHLRVALYDVRGRLVGDLYNGTNDGYIHSAEVGVGRGGLVLPSPGVYFARMYIDQRPLTKKKIVLLK